MLPSSNHSKDKKKLQAKRLGKGLEALFNQKEISVFDMPEKHKPNANQTYFSYLKLTEIFPNPEQPRAHFEPEKMEELAQSLRSMGMIEPIVVAAMENKSGYLLIAGERRWRAAKVAGFETIPAVIKNQSQDAILELMLIENIQREDLSAIEEATSYELILKKRNFTQEQLAERVGKSRAHITNLLRLLRLPQTTQKYLAEKKISAGHAKILVGLPEDTIEKLTDKILSQGISVREVERLAFLEKKKLHDTSTTSSAVAPLVSRKEKRDVDLIEAEQLLREALHTKVKLFPLKNKVGKIEIEYYSLDELDRFFKKLI